VDPVDGLTSLLVSISTLAPACGAGAAALLLPPDGRFFAPEVFAAAQDEMRAPSPRAASLSLCAKGVSMRGMARFALSEMRLGHLSTPCVPEYRLAIHDGARVTARFLCSGASSLGPGCP